MNYFDRIVKNCMKLKRDNYHKIFYTLKTMYMDYTLTYPKSESFHGFILSTKLDFETWNKNTYQPIKSQLFLLWIYMKIDFLYSF